MDSFFWPMLRYNSKTVSHEYDVPAPEDDDYERHDEAVYSLWQHYVDFCLLCTRGPSESASGNKGRFNKAGSCSDVESLAARKAKYSHRSGVRESVEQQMYDDVNRYISKERLSAFKALGRGLSLVVDAAEAITRNVSVHDPLTSDIEALLQDLPVADCLLAPGVDVDCTEVQAASVPLTGDLQPIVTGLHLSDRSKTPPLSRAIPPPFTSPERPPSAYAFMPITQSAGGVTTAPAERPLPVLSPPAHIPIPPPDKY